MGSFIKTDDEHKTVEVGLEVLMIEEGDYIVAYCPALELSSYGDNEEDAKQAFEDALDIFFEETHERGTLEKILLDLGWGLRKIPSLQYDPPDIRSLPYKYGNKESKTIQERVLIPV